MTGIMAALLFPATASAQRVETFTDERDNVYVAINAEELPRRVVDRTDNPDAYYGEANLYTYTADGTNSSPVTDESGGQVVVKRVIRHTYVSQSVTKRFIISPTDVYNDGAIVPGIVDATGNNNSLTMDWATANGWLATANSTAPATGSSATAMGCPQYRGKDGLDEPGTWRVPNKPEGVLILVLLEQIEDTAAETGFEPMYRNSTINYWLGSESSSASQACAILLRSPFNKTITSDGTTKRDEYYLRCIKDVK